MKKGSIGKRKNVVGDKYGKLTVLSDLADRIDGANRMRRWVSCECECGAKCERKLIALTHGASVGTPACTMSCAQTGQRKNVSTHHMHGTPTYKAWRGMKDRCKSAPTYIDKGIVVCGRWAKSFDNFLEDMGVKPEGKRISVERKDNDLGYSPDNCIWSTPKVQANNRSSNKRFHGRSLEQWSVLSGIPASVIGSRLRSGMDFKKALKTPVQPRNKPSINGLTYTEVAKKVGVHQSTIFHRKAQGWTDDEIENVPKGMTRLQYYRKKHSI